jgi:hypothetical protein
MLYYVYFSNAGTPVTTLTPTWETLNTAGSTNLNKLDITEPYDSDPAFNNIGGGWYSFDITYGVAPWDVTTEDLVGVIDGGVTMTDPVDRYKPVVISLRGLALARIAHAGVQDKATGDVTIYKTNGVVTSPADNKELVLNMHDSGSTITRQTMPPTYTD